MAYGDLVLLEQFKIVIATPLIAVAQMGSYWLQICN
jgi:hypothetical protein